jgi:hypothetical protein
LQKLLVLLIVSIAVVAGLMFGLNLTSFGIVIVGAAVALIFAVGAYVAAKREGSVASGASRSY